jgi:hypothetical protein
MIFKEFYQLPTFEEMCEAVLAKGLDDTTTVEGFLKNFESPYLALQMIIYSMLQNKIDNIDLIKSENFKTFTNYGTGKNKMTSFMASTTFPSDYSALFKNIFPESTENPVIWAKEHKNITADLNSPQVRQLILTMVKKYLN